MLRDSEFCYQKQLAEVARHKYKILYKRAQKSGNFNFSDVSPDPWHDHDLVQFCLSFLKKDQFFLR